jgi:hypothetical protein
MNIEYTKINKILEVNNDMVHNYYYIYYGRIYNENKTRYRKFKYIEWFDIFDIQEYFEKEWVTKEDIKEYASNIENSYLLTIKDYNDTKGLKEFYNFCRESIENYNKIVKYY